MQERLVHDNATPRNCKHTGFARRQGRLNLCANHSLGSSHWSCRRLGGNGLLRRHGSLLALGLVYLPSPIAAFPFCPLSGLELGLGCHNPGWICVGLTLKLLGLPGEVAMVVDRVHDPGQIEIKQTPAMAIASLFSIADLLECSPNG